MSVDKSLGGTLRQMNKDINSLWARIARTTPVAGTVALRDLTFPPPSTIAEQVDLANQQVTWWNTEMGWQESYYAPSGSPGLTALGLVAGAPAGWYPTGEGPSITMVPTVSFPMTSAPAAVRGWGALGSGLSRRQGGADWLTYDNATGRVQMVKAGVYQVYAKTVINDGSTMFTMALLLGPVATLTNVFDTYITQNSSYYFTAEFAHDGWVALPSDVAVVWNFNGNATFHMRSGTTGFSGGELSVRYVGPPLVSD